MLRNLCAGCNFYVTVLDITTVDAFYFQFLNTSFYRFRISQNILAFDFRYKLIFANFLQVFPGVCSWQPYIHYVTWVQAIRKVLLRSSVLGEQKFLTTSLLLSQIA